MTALSPDEPFFTRQRKLAVIGVVLALATGVIVDNFRRFDGAPLDPPIAARSHAATPTAGKGASMLKWTLIIVLAVGAGAAAGLWTGKSETALAFQAWVAGSAEPAAEDARGPKLEDYAVSFSVYDPKSLGDAFELDGKPDPTVKDCFAGKYEGDSRPFTDVVQYHAHRATTKAVHCLLTRSPERFCRPGARRLVAAASEIYFWSRDYVLSAPEEAERKHHLKYLNDDTNNPEGADRYFKTWDGPEDRQVLADLQGLARDGYIDPATFSMSRRPEVREAIAKVKKEHSPCPGA